MQASAEAYIHHCVREDARLSDVLSRTDPRVTDVSVILSEGASLHLDSTVVRPHVLELSVRGPAPPCIRHWALASYPGIPERLTGDIADAMRALPSLRALHLDGLTYDVAWGGLEASGTLTRLTLWNCEDATRPLVFPAGCRVDFMGLVTLLEADPDRAAAFLRHALQKKDVAFRWSSEYYAPQRISILKAVKRDIRAVDGAYQEELLTTEEVASDPSPEAQLQDTSVDHGHLLPPRRVLVHGGLETDPT